MPATNSFSRSAAPAAPGDYVWKVSYSDPYGTFAGWLLLRASESTQSDYLIAAAERAVDALFGGARYFALTLERQDVDTTVTFHTHT